MGGASAEAGAYRHGVTVWTVTPVFAGARRIAR